MSNITDLKIPVFTGINDQPTLPTASKAGNGSHIVSVINSLIDALSNLSASPSSGWNVVSEDTTLLPNSKNLIAIGSNNDTTILLTTPTSLTPGTYVTLLKAQENITCQIVVSYQIFNHSFSTITLDKINEEITLIYLDNAKGWIMSRNDVLTLVTTPQ